MKIKDEGDYQIAKIIFEKFKEDRNKSEEDFKKYEDLLHNISAYEAKNTCPACYGAGVIPGELVGCYHCSGTGILIQGR